MIKFQQTRQNRDMDYIEEATLHGYCGTRGPHIDRCIQRIKEHIGVGEVLLTTSATMALDIAAQALPEHCKGGEVIIPSWTFPTTVTPFLRAGLQPVFCDVDYRTLNMTYETVEAVLSSKTVAVVVVHYAGMAADTAEIKRLCDERSIWVIEDAAPAYLTPGCGQIGDMAVFSFNDTKNIGCGEGGAFIINSLSPNPKLAASMMTTIDALFHKGTNYTAAKNGLVELYTWVENGLAPQMTNLTAALLLDELNAAKHIIEKRLIVWKKYQELLVNLPNGIIQMPQAGNGHFYWLMFPSPMTRKIFMELMTHTEIETSRHYMALHESPMGKTFGRVGTDCTVSLMAEKCIVRLPIHTMMTPGQVAHVSDHAVKCARVALSAATLS